MECKEGMFPGEEIIQCVKERDKETQVLQSEKQTFRFFCVISARAERDAQRIVPEDRRKALHTGVENIPHAKIPVRIDWNIPNACKTTSPEPWTRLCDEQHIQKVNLEKYLKRTGEEMYSFDLSWVIWKGSGSSRFRMNELYLPVASHNAPHNCRPVLEQFLILLQQTVPKERR